MHRGAGSERRVVAALIGRGSSGMANCCCLDALTRRLSGKFSEGLPDAQQCAHLEDTCTNNELGITAKHSPACRGIDVEQGVTPDQGPIAGREAIVAYFAGLSTAFPDARV
jgi:hypothetical protein